MNASLENFYPAIEFIIKRELGVLGSYTKNRKRKVCHNYFFYFFLDKSRLLLVLFNILRFEFKVNIDQNSGMFILDHKSNKYSSYFSTLTGKDLNLYKYRSKSFFKYLFFLVTNKNIDKKKLFNDAKIVLHFIFKYRKKYPLPVSNKLINFFIYFLNYSMLFDLSVPSSVFVSDDISVERLAVSLVANKNKIPVIYGQISFLNFNPPPFFVDVALLKSREAIEYFINKAKVVYQVEKVEWDRIKIRKIPHNVSSIGILTNNFLNRDKLLEFIKIIRKKYPDALICIRYHPRTRKKLDLSAYGILESEAQESLKEFSKKYDYVVASRTSSQTEALINGCPVLQVSGMDNGGFDNNVGNRIVIGCKLDNFYFFDEELINKFYLDEKWKKFMEKSFSADKNINLASKNELKKYLKNYLQ